MCGCRPLLGDRDPKEPNADVRRTGSLSTGNRGRLLAPSHLAGGKSFSQALLDEVMSAEQIEKKVEDYLRDSQALGAYLAEADHS